MTNIVKVKLKSGILVAGKARHLVAAAKNFMKPIKYLSHIILGVRTLLRSQVFLSTKIK